MTQPSPKILCTILGKAFFAQSYKIMFLLFCYLLLLLLEFCVHPNLTTNSKSLIIFLCGLFRTHTVTHAIVKKCGAILTIFFSKVQKLRRAYLESLICSWYNLKSVLLIKLPFFFLNVKNYYRNTLIYKIYIVKYIENDNLRLKLFYFLIQIKYYKFKNV